MSSKSGIQGIAEGRSDIFRIDPRKLAIRPEWNCRDFNDPANIEHIKTLAASIREVGVKEPLTVVWEEGQPMLTNGECRLRAVLSLIEAGHDISTVPVQTEPRYATEQDKLASQIIRNSGKPFTPLEQAALFAKLRDLDWTDQQIAEKAGYTVERVRQIMVLAQAPEAVKAQIREGVVSSTMAQRAIQQQGAEQAEKTLEKAAERAKAEGKTKASPRHVKAVEDVSKEAPAPRLNYRDLFAELWSYLGDVQEVEGQQIGSFTIPADRWSAFMEASEK